MVVDILEKESINAAIAYVDDQYRKSNYFKDGYAAIGNSLPWMP